MESIFEKINLLARVVMLVKMLLYVGLLNRDALFNYSEAVPKVPLKMYYGGFQGSRIGHT